MDIKATMEVIQLLKDVGAAIVAAKADGSIDWRDALNKETRALIPDLQAAIKDGHLIPAELADLDGEESKQVYGGVVEALVVLAEAVIG